MVRTKQQMPEQVPVQAPVTAEDDRRAATDGLQMMLAQRQLRSPAGLLSFHLEMLATEPRFSPCAIAVAFAVTRRIIGRQAAAAGVSAAVLAAEQVSFV